MMNRREFVLGATMATAAAALGESVTGLAPTKPNIVLVHGAFADGSCWADVIALLQGRGFKVTAVQNPLTSLAEDVEATRRILALQDGPTILVGHSWAGTVISEAGVDDNVKGLVYIAARAPDAGEDYAALARKFPTPAASSGIVHTGGYAQLSEEAFLRDFAGGVDAARARVLFAVQGRISDTLFASKTSVAAWHTKPAWYAISTEDRTTAPELQRYVSARMGAHTIEIPSGHLSMITHPKEIAELINEAATESMKVVK